MTKDLNKIVLFSALANYLELLLSVDPDEFLTSNQINQLVDFTDNSTHTEAEITLVAKGLFAKSIQEVFE